MTIKELVTRAMSTLTDSCDNTTYALLGLIAEVGEIAEIVAKGRRRGELRIDNDTLVTTTCDEEIVNKLREKLGDEVFDAFWFLILTCYTHGIDFEEVIERGLAKLAYRKATGTIDTHTDH